MTPEQYQTLANHIRANTAAAIVAALPLRNDGQIQEWYNKEASPVTKAWKSSVSANELFEETDLTLYDGLTAGKRDAWGLMLAYAPIDFTKARFRKAVQDAWGNTNSVAILEAIRRNATRFELVFGGSAFTTNTVAATKLNVEGELSVNDVSTALNNY
jgi:hypothetical protein